MEPISLCDSDSIFTSKVLIILLLLKCVWGWLLFSCYITDMNVTVVKHILQVIL